MKHCQLCGHSDLFRRQGGLCGWRYGGIGLRAYCGCACAYGDSPVLVRMRESGQWLKFELDNTSAEFTPDRGAAARLTLAGARWFERRCPFAIDIEVLP